MRLFTALWPDAEVLDEIDAALADIEVPGMRGADRARRHVTLRFHGDDADPDAEAARLRARAAGLAAPRLRAVGGGTFPGVLWTGIEGVPADLVRAAGGEPAGFVAHLTLARGRRPTVPAGLERFAGSWWTPDHVALVASGHPYRTVARVPFDAGGGGRASPRR